MSMDDDAQEVERAGWPSPAERARPGHPRGTAVELAGSPWTLADWVPDVGAAVWDRIVDDNILKGRYDAHDVLDAAHRLLRANYRLTASEAADLLLSGPPASLVPAVESALFGPRKERLTWGQWATSALLANGIDPTSIPPGMLRHVLAQLVGTGRALPEHKFISSQEYAARRSRRMSSMD
jgi:hypothetical protein